MSTTNTLPDQQNQQTNQPGNRPVVETAEKYEAEIMNLLHAEAKKQTRPAQQAQAFLNALEGKLDKNNPILLRIIRGKSYTAIGGAQNTITDLNSELSRLRNASDLDSVTIDPVTALIIRSLAEYSEHKAQEQQNQFDAIYTGQANDPAKSSTSQQIEGVSQRAKLTGAALYHRNGRPLRISYDQQNDRFEAQIIDQQGQLSTIQNRVIADLVTQIHAQSQAIRNISADTVQQNVEEREEIDFQQIAAAVEFINRGQTLQEREARTGFYSFDKVRFAIRGQGDHDFSVDIQHNEEGDVTVVNNVAQNALANLIKTRAKKKKEKKEGIETVDMGNDFSETAFRKLAREVSGSKDLVGDYKLNGQTFTLRQTSGIGVRPILYQTQYPDHTGRKQTYPQAGQANQASELNDVVAFLAQNIRTHGNEGNCTRDMGNDFSVNAFRDLAEEIGKSRNGRGNYKLAGKNYEIQADMPMPADINTVIFNVEHPNEFGIKITSHATLDGLLNQANHGPMSHIHAHDPNHPHEFTKALMMRVLTQAQENKRLHPDEPISSPERRVQFDFHGKICEAYMERLKRAGGVECYCVDMPNSAGGIDKIWSTTQAGLYKDFMKKAHADHSHDKDHEKGKESHGKEGADHKKDDHAEAHGDHAHDHSHDTMMDKTFKAVLPGWLAKIATKTKNFIPESVRKFGGATVSTALGGAAIGGTVAGGLVGASALGLTTMGTAAALSFFGPVTLTAAGGIGVYKLYKWWKGGDGGSEGTHH